MLGSWGQKWWKAETMYKCRAGMLDGWHAGELESWAAVGAEVLEVCRAGKLGSCRSVGLESWRAEELGR